MVMIINQINSLVNDELLVFMMYKVCNSSSQQEILLMANNLMAYLFHPGGFEIV